MSDHKRTIQRYIEGFRTALARYVAGEGRAVSLDSNLPLLRDVWAKEAGVDMVPRPKCHCVDAQDRKATWSELTLHTEQQDEGSSGWARLLELIEEAANDHREEFSPCREMKPEQWAQIVTLPPSIAKLKSLKHLILYGSSLVRIPPEIGEMASLKEFTTYTSYRLHWYPFELTRCKKLKRSTVSTRALYGNYKYRPPFPRLPQLHDVHTPKRCSLCDIQFGESVPMQYWVSLGVGTDVVPLLVHACSKRCLSKIRTPPKGYVQSPHQGGLGLAQPRPD